MYAAVTAEVAAAVAVEPPVPAAGGQAAVLRPWKQQRSLPPTWPRRWPWLRTGKLVMEGGVELARKGARETAAEVVVLTPLRGVPRWLWGRPLLLNLCPPVADRGSCPRL